MAYYYNSNDSSFVEIPKAPYYVLSNDKFMSGWGGSKGKINTCVVPCDTYEQAQSVVRYVETRDEQKHIRIASKVRSKANVVYSMCEAWRDRAKEREPNGGRELIWPA